MQGVSILHAVLLGIIQGATEFLPVSSSGHLVLAQHLLGIKLNAEALLAFDIALHFGTLMALFVFFWRDILLIGRGVIGKPSSGDPSPQTSRQLFWNLIVATLPAVVIGLGFKHLFEQMFTDMFSTGIQFLITGVILWLTRYVRSETRQMATMSWWHALLIGIAQAIAIIPAISRSGMTIATALLLRYDREGAARFSFLLAVPALAGATILSLKDLQYFSSEDMQATIIGTLVSFVVALACIKWLMNIIRRGKFSWFAVYCWVIGVIAIFLSVR